MSKRRVDVWEIDPYRAPGLNIMGPDGQLVPSNDIYIGQGWINDNDIITMDSGETLNWRDGKHMIRRPAPSDQGR